MPSKLVRLLFFLAALGLITGIAAAQETITYGQSVEGQIDEATPQVFYAFNGSAGDLVAARVIGTSDNLQPTLALFGASGGQLAFNSQDVFTASGRDAGLTYRLPTSGGYTLIVGAAPGTQGSFLLTLESTAPAVSNGLSPDQPITVNIPQGAPSQVYSFNASPNAPTEVAIRSETVDFGFTALVRDPAGQLVAVVNGGVRGASFQVGPGEGTYEVTLSSADPASDGTLSIALGGEPAQPPPPQTTQEATQPETGDVQPPANVCSVTPANAGVNVRAGNDTNFDVVGTLLPNTFATVNGQNSGWYNISFDGRSGWVAGFVVSTSGPCDDVPFMEAPAAPEAPPPPQATEEAGAPPPTSPPPPQETEEAPPPPTESAQIAPPDAEQLNWTIDRDDGGQFSEVVSYPDGDTTDRVRMTIGNLFNQPPNNARDVNITLVCNGTGTENLQWGTGGPNSPTPHGCGSSANVFHTDDSNQTFIYITIPGGSTSYVNYTLIAAIAE